MTGWPHTWSSRRRSRASWRKAPTSSKACRPFCRNARLNSPVTNRFLAVTQVVIRPCGLGHIAFNCARLDPGMRRLGRFAVALALFAGTALTVLTTSAASASAPAASGLNHVFLIMEENNRFQDVIGKATPQTQTDLPNTFGLQTDYYSNRPCRSE